MLRNVCFWCEIMRYSEFLRTLGPSRESDAVNKDFDTPLFDIFGYGRKKDSDYGITDLG